MFIHLLISLTASLQLGPLKSSHICGFFAVSCGPTRATFTADHERHFSSVRAKPGRPLLTRDYHNLYLHTFHRMGLPLSHPSRADNLASHMYHYDYDCTRFFLLCPWCLANEKSKNELGAKYSYASYYYNLHWSTYVHRDRVLREFTLPFKWCFRFRSVVELHPTFLMDMGWKRSSGRRGPSKNITDSVQLQVLAMRREQGSRNKAQTASTMKEGI